MYTVLTKSRSRLKRLRAETPSWSQQSAKFSGHKSCENKGNTLVLWSKSHVALRVGASQSKLAYCLVGCPWVSCKWRYTLFNLPYDLTKPRHWKIMQLYEWELLIVCHHPAKFIGQRYSGSGDMFLVCWSISQESKIKISCDFMDRSPSREDITQKI